jgi:hypothetical protein
VSTIPTIPNNTKTNGPLSRKEMMQFLPSKRAIDVFTALTSDTTAVVDQSNALATEIDSFNFNFDALNADVLTLQAEDVNLQTQIDALGSGGSDAIDGVFYDGVGDNTTLLRNALGPAGSIVTAGKTRALLDKGGSYLSGFVDVHPQISLEMSARGGKLLVPKNNLPALTSNYDGITDTSVGHVYGGGAYGAGAPGALVRLPRLSPTSGSNLAWQQVFSGFNVDARGTTQTNAVALFRSPNPDNTENLIDGDPLYTGNKDYTAPHFENMDVIGGPGTGYRGEAGNGRLAIHSARFLSNGNLNVAQSNHGLDSSGNDVVIYGHSAFGSNSGFGAKFGAASGLLATSMNVWGAPAYRSAACGALWFNGRRSFAVATSVLNDFIRFDGASNYQQGGVFCANSYATHDENFVSEGVAININNDGDQRCQADNTVGGYRVLNFVGNMYSRCTKVLFDTWQNVGGALDGKFGTAYRWIYDAHDQAAFNVLDQVNTGPNCKPWTGNTNTFTAAGAVITCNNHKLQDGYKLALYTAGTLPAGLQKGITYFVVGSTTNTFGLAYTPGGAAVTTTDAGTGTHTWGNLSTLPYGTRDNATVNYILQDSWRGETRIGATGLGNPGHALICISDSDMAALSARSGTFTFTYTSASVYTLNCTNHGMSEGDPVTLQVSAGGTLPGGLKLSVQYWATNCNANDFQLMDVPINGTIVTVTNTAGSGTFTFSSWYRTYTIEMGDRTLHAGVPGRNAAYGRWEFGKAVGYQSQATDAFSSTAGTFAHTVKAGIRTVRASLSTTNFTTGAFTLPSGVDIDASQPMRIVVTGKPCASLTWAFTQSEGWASGTPTAPASVPAGGLVVDLWYEKGVGWELKSAALTDGGLIGRIDNVSAPTGVVGEQIQVKVASGSAVSTGATNAIANVASITLTPGDWNVWGEVVFTSTSSASATVLTKAQAVLSTTSAANFTSSDASSYTIQTATSNVSATGAGTDMGSVQIGPTRITVAGTTQQVWLNVRPNMTGTVTTNAVGAWGNIRAIRTT